MTKDLPVRAVRVIRAAGVLPGGEVAEHGLDCLLLQKELYNSFR
jgi:hypothetical protein